MLYIKGKGGNPMARIEPPTRQELQTLLGDSLPAWDALTHHIEDKYEMDVL